MCMFWGFLLRLIIGGLLAPLVFSLTVFPLVLGVAALATPVMDTTPYLKPMLYPLWALAMLIQAYFWGMWAIFCATLTKAYLALAAPHWLYYLAGFMAVAVPLEWLSHKELRTLENPGAQRDMMAGIWVYKLVSWGVFLAFFLAPKVVTVPYGWLAKFILAH